MTNPNEMKKTMDSGGNNAVATAIPTKEECDEKRKLVAQLLEDMRANKKGEVTDNGAEQCED